MNGQTKLREAAAGLIDLADVVKDNDDLADRIASNLLPVFTCLYADSKKELQELMRRFAPMKKLEGTSNYELKRCFSPYVQLKLFTYHEKVCRQELVGKKRIKFQRVFIPAVFEEVEEEVDDVRWICPDSILDNGVIPSSSSTEEIQTTQGEPT